MKSLHRAAALLLCANLSSTGRAIMVGDEVCITGFIMDRCECAVFLFPRLSSSNIIAVVFFSPHTSSHSLFHQFISVCIEDTDGTLLDNPNVISLQSPEEHSFHCLLDVGVCYESGFTVLGDKDPATDRHCVGFRLDDTDAILAAGRAAGKRGYCSTCTGTMDSDPEYGYRATIRGVVDDLGDGSDDVSDRPQLTNIQVLDASVGCDGNPTIPPGCPGEINWDEDATTVAVTTAAPETTVEATTTPEATTTAEATTTVAESPPPTPAPVEMMDDETPPPTPAPVDDTESSPASVMVGDEVCITGYIMDKCEC